MCRRCMTLIQKRRQDDGVPGGFLREAAEFEPGFFGISPAKREHRSQQRLLLETSVGSAGAGWDRAWVAEREARRACSWSELPDYAVREHGVSEGARGVLGLGSAGSVRRAGSRTASGCRVLR